MVICKYWSSGNCRFGTECKFEHIGNLGAGGQMINGNPQMNLNQQPRQPFGNQQQQPFGNQPNQSSIHRGGGGGSGSGGRGGWSRGGGFRGNNRNRNPGYNRNKPGMGGASNSIEEAITHDLEENFPLWPLTCYGRDAEVSIIHNDMSPEELRAEAYAAVLQGAPAATVFQQEAAIVSQQHETFRALLEKCKQTKQNNQPSAGGFGQPQQQPSLQQQPLQQNLFAQQPQGQQANNPFAQSQQPLQQQGSVFPQQNNPFRQF